MNATKLLWLYPRRWRKRYGEEFALVLAEQRSSPRVVLDVIAGAIDAHVNPQRTFRPRPAGAGEGEHMTTRFLPSCGAAYASADQRRSVFWLVGGALALTAIALGLQLAVGKNAITEALMYAAFPMSLVFSTHCTYMKPYSRVSKAVILTASAGLIFAVTLAATMVAYLL